MKKKKEIEDQLIKFRMEQNSSVFAEWDNPPPSFSLKEGYILALEWVIDQEKP